MISVRPASWVIVWHGKNFNVAIFLDTINVINVKLCLMVLLIELYLPFDTASNDFNPISRSQQCQLFSNDIFLFLSN